MIYSQVIITRKGQSLIAKLHASGASTQIVSIGTGNGTRTLTEESTQLTNQMQETPVDGVSIDPNNPTKIVVEVAPNNIGLSQAYDIKEIGIYATDPDEGKILYAVINTVGQDYDHMPAYESEQDYKEVIYKISLIVDNAENVSFIVSSEELRQQFEETTRKVDAVIAANAEERNALLLLVQGFSAKTTQFLQDGDIRETGDMGTKLTEFLDDGSIRETFTNLAGQSIVKTTVFNADDSITETIS